MPSVLVANPKGGCGKTTLATNLAGFFANQGANVTLCDLDRQQSSLRWLAFRQEHLPGVSGFYGGNQMMVTPPTGDEWMVIDAPAGLQGYKLNDTVRRVDKVVVPLVPSLFDMAATEDFLLALRKDMIGRRNSIGIVAMRVDPRTRAAVMLEEFLSHFDLPIIGYLRNTQNYVNVAAAGATIFDPPKGKSKKDVQQWETLLEWVESR
jgi:chromosome partitioning protein